MNKKILFITYENPFTRNSGDSIYTCNILDGLFGLSNIVDIIYFDSNLKESEINGSDQKKFHKTEVVKFKKKNTLKYIFSSLPGMIVNRKSKEYNLLLENILLNSVYDIIFLNHQKMMFTIPSLLKYKENSKLIYISHNVEYLLSINLVKYNRSFIKKIVYWQDAIKTKLFEKKWNSCFDVITAISEHDANYFRDIYKHLNVQILRPIFNLNEEVNSVHGERKLNNLIIGGSFDWKPKKENLLLFLNAKNFKELENNDIKLIIVGRADPKFVDFVNRTYSGVHMTGGVPSLTPYYQKSGLAIIPERLGGGFKLKIVEAALHRSAIIAIKGAITECNFIKNRHFLEKDTFEELILEIIRIQNEPELLDNLIENAFIVAKQEYTLNKMIDSLEKII